MSSSVCQTDSIVKESRDDEFFTISSEFLSNRKIFPYHIYVYNPYSKEYFALLKSNSVMSDSKEDFITKIIQRNAILCVPLSQEKTFLTAHNIKKEDIPSLNNKKSKEEIEHIQYTKYLKKYLESNREEYINCLRLAFMEDNFTSLLEFAQKQIQVIPYTISSSATLAIELSAIHLQQDTLLSRKICLALAILKNTKLNNYQNVGDLVIAIFFHHIGLSQLDIDISSNNESRLNEQQRTEFKKHAGISKHLLMKTNIDLPPKVYKLIEEHHERSDGTGFPDNKLEAFIDPLSLVLGASSHIIDFSRGKINGNKMSLKVVLELFYTNTSQAFLDMNFGEVVLEAISNIYSDISGQKRKEKNIDERKIN